VKSWCNQRFLIDLGGLVAEWLFAFSDFFLLVDVKIDFLELRLDGFDDPQVDLDEFLNFGGSIKFLLLIS